MTAYAGTSTARKTEQSFSVRPGAAHACRLNLALPQHHSSSSQYRLPEFAPTPTSLPEFEPLTQILVTPIHTSRLSIGVGYCLWITFCPDQSCLSPSFENSFFPSPSPLDYLQGTWQSQKGDTDKVTRPARKDQCDRSS